MADNSRKMTLEERIVQTLKDDSLLKLVGDEDAITELVTRAIREALFQPTRVPRQYGGGFEEKDSLVVSVARDVAKKYAEKLSGSIVDELLGDPKNKALLRSAIVDMLPAALNGYLSQMVYNLTQSTAQSAIESLRQMKASGDNPLG